MKRLLHAGRQNRYAIDTPAVVSAIIAGTRCPLCGGPGQWRQGVHFEHERRCDACEVNWEPEHVYLIVETEDAK